MVSYEVVIVGAGPAGLMCAKTLAESGKGVIVLEKNKRVGFKVCAGGLTRKDLKLGIPKKILGIGFKKQILHTPYSTTVFKDKKPIVVTVERKDLCRWLAKEAQKAGAVIKTEACVSKVKQNSVVANNKEIGFKYLVGADGAASVVRRSLGLKTNKIDIAMQYITKQKFKEMEWFLDSKLFASGLAWIFPHKNYTSIGVGADPRHISSGNLRTNFQKWLKNMKIDVSNAKFEAAVINYDYQGYHFNNKFLVGDAAGFSSGLTGEGMYNAMVSGEDVAKLIANPEYKSLQIDGILKLKKFHEVLLSALEFSGPLRVVEYELLSTLLKNKLLRKSFEEIMG